MRSPTPICPSFVGANIKNCAALGNLLPSSLHIDLALFIAQSYEHLPAPCLYAFSVAMGPDDPPAMAGTETRGDRMPGARALG